MHSSNSLRITGAIVALSGFVLSGPVAFALVATLGPQPPWSSAKVFVDNYQLVQDLPYYLGFLLVAGVVMLGVSHISEGRTKNKSLLAFASTIVFATLIVLNYLIQTTFVHNLALHYDPVYDPIVAGFSMANPMSFCWANEMWGYAFLGLATWLWSPQYKTRPVLRNLLIANGVISVSCPFLTIINVNWVMTIPGLIGYFLWNALMIVITWYILTGDKSIGKYS